MGARDAFSCGLRPTLALILGLPLGAPFAPDQGEGPVA